MTDVFSKQKRSDIMSKINGRGNRATELRLIYIFREYKITGWRRNYPLFGKPDFVFPEIRLALFVDGCFWHSCPEHGMKPATNRAFWERKLTLNRNRDKLVNKTLRSKGWKVLRIWQHELKIPANIIKRVIRQRQVP
jgi:DNA mismatch endonuclease, patch repair protein